MNQEKALEKFLNSDRIDKLNEWDKTVPMTEEERKMTETKDPHWFSIVHWFEDFGGDVMATSAMLMLEKATASNVKFQLADLYNENWNEILTTLEEAASEDNLVIEIMEADIDENGDCRVGGETFRYKPVGDIPEDFRSGLLQQMKELVELNETHSESARKEWLNRL